MIISCEKCATKYNINSTFIGLEGRKVKCTTCKHVWHASLTEEEKNHLKKEQQTAIKKDSLTDPIVSINESLLQDKTEQSQSNPSILKNLLPTTIAREMPLWLKIIPITIIFLCIAIFVIFYSHNVVNFFPETANIYKKFGIFSTDGIVLQDIKLHKLSNEGEYFDVLIKGKIVNNNANEKIMPALRLSILNSAGENIVSSISNSDHSVLAPGEEFIINNKITNLNSKAKYIAIDIGDKIELLLR